MNSNKIAIIILTMAVLFAGYITLGGQTNGTAPAKESVTMENGKQIIEITAKGGYSPRSVTAKAGIPTVLRIRTNNTFDCSSFIRIPDLNISQNLPQTGTTDFDLGTTKAGTLRGMCGMGMYQFSIDFK